MKLLIVEDFRDCGGVFGEDSAFRVKEMENTVEWHIDDFISESSMRQILSRHGTHTVKVRIKKAKNRGF